MQRSDPSLFPWVSNYLSGVTLTLHTAAITNSMFWFPNTDDAYSTFARVRLLSHSSTFKMEKKEDIWGTSYLEFLSAHSSGILEDLYDFNTEAPGAGADGGIEQLGHGNGSYGTSRSSGVIYKVRVQFDQNINF